MYNITSGEQRFEETIFVLVLVSFEVVEKNRPQA